MSLKVAGTVLSTIGIVCVIVSTFTPGWLLNVVGLFYGCTLGACVVMNQLSIVNIVTLAFMVVAVVLLLPGVILAFIGCKSNARHLRTSGALVITGGIFAFLGAAAFTGFIAGGLSAAGGVSGALGYFIVLSFGYSYWFAWLGGLAAVIGGALNVAASKSVLA